MIKSREKCVTGSVCIWKSLGMLKMMLLEQDLGTDLDLVLEQDKRTAQV